MTTATNLPEKHAHEVVEARKGPFIEALRMSGHISVVLRRDASLTSMHVEANLPRERVYCSSLSIVEIRNGVR